MTKLLLTISALILLPHFLLTNARGTTFTEDNSAEECAVYSALITDMFSANTSVDTSKIKLLVVEDFTTTDRTSGVDSDLAFQEMFPKLSQQVVNDYRAKNKESVRLKDCFDVQVKHLLAEKPQIEKIFKDGGGLWDAFYKQYPDAAGLIGVSRIGFDAGMKRALVYIQHGCGGLCGTGSYALLEKGVDGWRVVKRQIVWIS